VTEMLKKVLNYETEWKNIGKFNDLTIIRSMGAMFLLKKPLVLTGKSGVGKNRFAEHVAKNMDFTYRYYGDDVETASRALVSCPKRPALIVVEDIRKQQYTKLLDVYKKARKNHLCVIDNRDADWDRGAVVLPEPSKAELKSYVIQAVMECGCNIDEKYMDIIVYNSNTFRDIRLNMIFFMCGYEFSSGVSVVKKSRVDSPLLTIKLEGYYLVDNI